ncbi:MAG TPA: cyclic nucleotide-binding domain-containing protein [Steroidobacteraceae bacterium]|nr:cyclic nucleotide-binding domain-containing protein [Steroidobacteraceae bacterium]
MAHLGRVYADREVIVRQGEPGTCMYVIQDGQVEAVAEAGGREMRLRTLGPSDFFGEMALFGSESRSCTIRALGKARVLTIDKKNFLEGIQEDPSLAFRIVKVMSQRIHDLTERLAEYETRK